MELVQLKGPEIEFKPNRKLEVTKNTMLIAYVVLETLYKTIFGKYLAVEMERLQCVVGAVLACLLLVEWFRLDKDNKIKWVKRHAIVFLYFAIRVITFINIGFQYTMLRSVFFEGIYLLVITELIVNSEFCKKRVFKFFVLSNLFLNIINVFFYFYCENAFDKGTFFNDPIYNFAIDYTYIRSLAFYNHCSMYSNPNQMGIMTGIAFLLSISYFSKAWSGKRKICYAFYCMFSLYCVVLSNCSSSHAGLFLVAGIFLIVKKFRIIDVKKILILATLGALLITGMVYGFVHIHGNSVEYTLFEKQLDAVSSSRYTIWKDSYYSHQEELILGCGNITLEKRDRYQYNLDKGNDLGLDIDSSLIDYVGPHNGYIGTISCAGLLGFAAFIALLLKKINDSKSLNQGYWYLAIIFILVINLFECMMPISKNFVTLYMFLILAMDDREETV